MKLIKTILFALLALASASVAFGQGQVAFLYANDQGTLPPLRNTCDETGTPLPDGTVINIYWDNNNNGRDAADVQPEIGTCYGCANFVSVTMNGELFGFGPGYFGFENYFYVLALPTGEDFPNYYLEITTPEPNSMCWYTDPYVLQPGSDDEELTAAMWHCVAGPCRTGGTAPAAPTNVTASDDENCMQVELAWEHDGANLLGFNILANNERVAGASAEMRSLLLDVASDVPVQFTVSAFNAAGTSEPAAADAGSSFARRFVEGPEGDIPEGYQGGAVHTLHFDVATDACPTRFDLYLIDFNGLIVDTLASDSLDDTTAVEIPIHDGWQDMRVLMMAQMIDRPIVILTDTTENYFIADTASAVGERDLVNPERFDLSQNYPNPFNPETNIVFSVPQQADVKLTIYNIAGQTVRTLVAGTYTAGVHHVAWDGRSDAGTMVSTGLYIYRLEGPGIAITKKMLMLK